MALLAALAHGRRLGAQTSAEPQFVDTVSSSAVCASPVANDAAGALHPGDVIHIKTLDDPSLTKDYTVPADGVVQFWKAGQYKVTTMTPACLKAHIIQQYGRNLAHPSDIEVTVTYRIAVSGAVKNPGVFNADVTMSVADLLAMAGGINGDGDPGNVVVMRDRTSVPLRLSASTGAVTTMIRSGDRIDVGQKSWIARNVAPTITAASAAMYLLVTAFR